MIKKENKLICKKKFNICDNADIRKPKFNQKELEKFYQDLSNDINVAKINNYQKTFSELKDMSKEEQVKYVELMEKIKDMNINDKNSDTANETIELLDLIGKNVKNNTPIYTSESKPKEKSK